MNSHMGNSRALETILQARHRTVVLLGPAASGKTTTALGFHRSFAPGACLMLAPNSHAAKDLKRRLVSDSQILVMPEVMTFTDLARRILIQSRKAPRTISALGRYLLIRRIVRTLRDEGKATLLGALIDTPGLVGSIDRAIAELKRPGIDPDQLSGALAKNQMRGLELLRVYRVYQQHLLDNNLYDVEGLQWEARRLLESSEELSDFKYPTAVCVDGFTDFSPTQLAILSQLAANAANTLITLPHDEDERGRMWWWTTRTLNNIRGRFGKDLQEIRLGADSTPRDGLARVLYDSLFRYDAPKVDPPDNFEVISACGRDAEIKAVSAQVKKKLLSGCHPRDIAVLVRNLNDYAPLLRHSRHSYGVIAVNESVSLASVPVIRFLLDVAGLGPRFHFSDVLAVIKSSYFVPESLGEFDASTPTLAEALIRWGNVVESRESYAFAADRFMTRLTRVVEDEDSPPVSVGSLTPSPEAVSNAIGMLERLFNLADKPGDLSALARTLDVRSAVMACGDERTAARDLGALDKLEEIADELSAEQLDAASLRAALESVNFTPAGSGGVVEAIDVLDARSLRFKHVYLLGVTEGQFPHKFSEGSLISENDRSAWSSRGMAMDCRGDLTAREMLLFYIACSRASDSLTVTCLEADSSGRPMQMSGFLVNLLEPFGGLDAMSARGRVKRILQGQFVPPREEIAPGPDAAAGAVSGLFNPQAQFSPGALQWLVENHRALLGRICAGLICRHRRWRGDGWDEFDGWITDERLARNLANRFSTAIFSCSQLNTFGQCPWSFFARYVLRLDPLDQPQRQLEPVTRGQFCHGVLFNLMTRLRDHFGAPFDIADVEEKLLRAEFDSAIERESQRVESRRIAYPQLWKIQRDQMTGELWSYLRSQREHSDATVLHSHFELGFGMKILPDEPCDEASVNDPITITTPSGDFRLRGKIDRIDMVKVDNTQGLMVVDYKQRTLPKAASIDAGQSVQLPLYALAVESILNEECIGGAYHSILGRTVWFSAVKYTPKNVSFHDHFDERRRLSIENIGKAVEKIRLGHYEPVPAGAPAQSCPSYCPYRTICHFSQARLEVKRPALETEGEDE